MIVHVCRKRGNCHLAICSMYGQHIIITVANLGTTYHLRLLSSNCIFFTIIITLSICITTNWKHGPYSTSSFQHYSTRSALLKPYNNDNETHLSKHNSFYAPRLLQFDKIIIAIITNFKNFWMDGAPEPNEEMNAHVISRVV